MTGPFGSPSPANLLDIICKPGGLRWHSRMPTECPIWKINSVSHLSRASLTLVFTDGCTCNNTLHGLCIRSRRHIRLLCRHDMASNSRVDSTQPFNNLRFNVYKRKSGQAISNPPPSSQHFFVPRNSPYGRKRYYLCCSTSALLFVTRK